MTVEHLPSGFAKCLTSEKFTDITSGKVYSRREFINLKNREHTVINMQPTLSTIMPDDDNISTDTYTIIH